MPSNRLRCAKDARSKWLDRSARRTRANRNRSRHGRTARASVRHDNTRNRLGTGKKILRRCMSVRFRRRIALLRLPGRIVARDCDAGKRVGTRQKILGSRMGVWRLRVCAREASSFGPQRKKRRRANYEGENVRPWHLVTSSARGFSSWVELPALTVTADRHGLRGRPSATDMPVRSTALVSVQLSVRRRFFLNSSTFGARAASESDDDITQAMPHIVL